jgi:hypothetical protein
MHKKWTVLKDSILQVSEQLYRLNANFEIDRNTGLRVLTRMNMAQIYDLAMKTLLELFTRFYPDWNGSTASRPQMGEGTFHKAHELSDLKAKILESPGDLVKQLNLIQALSYNDDRKAKVVLPNHEIWEVSLQLKRIQG